MRFSRTWLSDVLHDGEAVARSVHEFFKQPPNRKVLEKLRRAGLRTQEERRARKGGPLETQQAEVQLAIRADELPSPLSVPCSTRL